MYHCFTCISQVFLQISCIAEQSNLFGHVNGLSVDSFELGFPYLSGGVYVLQLNNETKLNARNMVKL